MEDLLSDNLGINAGTIQAPSNKSAAIIQVKTKILKQLSSQHMVGHLLPVVVSLKHCLEARKSPLQVHNINLLLY